MLGPAAWWVNLAVMLTTYVVLATVFDDDGLGDVLLGVSVMAATYLALVLARRDRR